MTYDANGFPTATTNLPVDPSATLRNPDTDVRQIPGTQAPDGSIYKENQVGFNKTLLLDRIFILLKDMISVLQNAAIAQSNRLTFLSEWQKAYTDTLDQVHAFAVANGDRFDDPDDDKDTTLISNLNQTNSIYTTQEQNRRSVISDDAKSLQTNVNQTTDAVNQQASLATSFLQELNTLLSTIFRSS